MSDPLHESGDAARARRRRNVALGCVLAAFVILVFVITIIRLSQHGFQPQP